MTFVTESPAPMKTTSRLFVLLARLTPCWAADIPPDTQSPMSAVSKTSPRPGDADPPTSAPSQRHTEKVAAVRTGHDDLVSRGDQPLAVDGPANSALIPVPKLEDDSYDWYARHAEVLRVKGTIDPEVVLLGDSITHFWGGEPRAGQANGSGAWQATFGKYRTLNLGFGWDRIQNVLWRIDHGEVDGLHPRVIVLDYRLPRGRALVPLLDAQRAIRMVRARSVGWGCDPQRIGIIGFSAGGHLAATAATHFDAGQPVAADPIERVGCRPDFAVLVYPVITMGEKTHRGAADPCSSMKCLLAWPETQTVSRVLAPTSRRRVRWACRRRRDLGAR